MVTVLLYFTSFLFVHYCSKSLNNEYDRVRFQQVSCFFMLFVFFGLRDLPVLNDTSHYYGHFYRLAKYTSFNEESIFHYDPNERFEYGYMIFLRFIGKYISSNPYSIILVSSLIITIANLKLISKYTDKIALTTFLFLLILPQQYNTIRQTFATVIFYIAFHFLENKRYCPYFLLVALAYMFHKSAIILLFFPIVSMLKVTRRNVISMLLISFCLAIAIYPILGYMGFGDSSYVEENLARVKAPLAAIMDVCYIALLLLGCWYMCKKFKINIPDRQLIWAAVFSLCCRIISVPFLVFGRFNGYFMPYVLLLFTYMIDNLHFTPLQYTSADVFARTRWDLRRSWQLRQCGSIFAPVILCNSGMVCKNHNNSFV